MLPNKSTPKRRSLPVAMIAAHTSILARWVVAGAAVALVAVGYANAAPTQPTSTSGKSPTAPATPTKTRGSASPPKSGRGSRGAPAKKWKSGGTNSDSPPKKWGNHHSDAERLVKDARSQGTDGRVCICFDAPLHRLGRLWVADVDAYKGGPALVGCRVPSFHPKTHEADPGGQASTKACADYRPLP